MGKIKFYDSKYTCNRVLVNQSHHHSFTHSVMQYFIYVLTKSLTPGKHPKYPLFPSKINRSPTSHCILRSLALSFTRTYAHSNTLFLTHSPIRYSRNIVLFPTHSFPRFLSSSLAHLNILSLILSLTQSPTHPLPKQIILLAVCETTNYSTMFFVLSPNRPSSRQSGKLNVVPDIEVILFYLFFNCHRRY